MKRKREWDRLWNVGLGTALIWVLKYHKTRIRFRLIQLSELNAWLYKEGNYFYAHEKLFFRGIIRKKSEYDTGLHDVMLNSTKTRTGKICGRIHFEKKWPRFNKLIVVKVECSHNPINCFLENTAIHLWIEKDHVNRATNRDGEY